MATQNEKNKENKVEGEVLIRCESEEIAERMERALKPEADGEKIKVERSNEGIIIRFKAKKVVEARAIANTILRLVRVVEEADML